jgi:hypothetical protein
MEVADGIFPIHIAAVLLPELTVFCGGSSPIKYPRWAAAVL